MAKIKKINNHTKKIRAIKKMMKKIEMIIVKMVRMKQILIKITKMILRILMEKVKLTVITQTPTSYKNI